MSIAPDEEDQRLWIAAILGRAERNAAAEALRLKLVTHLSDDGKSAEDAIRYAQDMAGKPSEILKALAKTTAYLRCDFETYLGQVGGGFTKLPPA